MDADETEIYNYLSSYNGEWVNAKEVCRRAGGKRRFAEDPSWARPVLLRMKDLRLVESDMAGRYRVKPEDEAEGHAPPPADGEQAGEGEDSEALDEQF